MLGGERNDTNPDSPKGVETAPSLLPSLALTSFSDKVFGCELKNLQYQKMMTYISMLRVEPDVPRQVVIIVELTVRGRSLAGHFIVVR